MNTVKRFKPRLSEHFDGQETCMREVDDGYFVTYASYVGQLKEAELYRYIRDSAGNELLDLLKTKITKFDFDLAVITDKIEYEKQRAKESTESTPF